MTETPDIRFKRLRLRAWRRGTREMDIILGGFADARLTGLSPEALAVFEDVLEENDQDLYCWIAGQAAPPAALAPLLAEIAAHARTMSRGGGPASAGADDTRFRV